VHIGARIAAEAWPSEVLMSRHRENLAAGSSIDVEDRHANAQAVPENGTSRRLASAGVPE
jgi:hypothetical protein